MIVLGIATVASCNTPARAQNEASEAVTSLQEIVVTARKRTESLQSVPLTITAVTADAIEAAGIRDVKSLSTMTPGFHFENAGSRQNSQPRIRGMDINTANPTRQNASFFVDGIYLPGATQSLDFSEFERIEIIKGPQSAQFGRQTFGGAVNFVTREPARVLRPEGAATVGSHGLREVTGSLSGPLMGGVLSGRIHLRGRDYDGAFRNALGGEPLGEQQSRSGSASLAWRPLESLRVDLRYLKQRDDDGPAPLLQLGASQLNCGPFFTGGRRFYCGALPKRGEYRLNHAVVANAQGIDRFGFDRDSELYSLKAMATFGQHELTIAGSRFRENSLDVADGDITGVAAYSSVNYQNFDDRSAEIRLASTSAGPIQYQVGLYWYDGQYTNNLFFTNANLSALPVYAAQLPDIAEATNRAAFGSLSYQLTDAMRASAEIRYQKDEVVNIGGQGAARRTMSGSTPAWLPRLILDYRTSSDVMLYGVYSKGNKPKQFNANLAGRSPAERDYVLSTYGVDVALDEERLTNYELGVKSAWLARRLILNAAAFQMDWKDQVTRRQVFPSGTSTTQLDVVANAGSSRIRGLELESRFAATEALELEGTYALIDAKFTEFNSANVQQVFGDADTSGKASARFPRHQGSLAVTYRVALSAAWTGSLRADQTYKGRRWTDEVNLAYADTYWRTGLRATLERGPLAITAYVENLTADAGIESASRYRDISVPGNQFSFVYGLSEGRLWGLKLLYAP